MSDSGTVPPLPAPVHHSSFARYDRPMTLI